MDLMALKELADLLDIYSVRVTGYVKDPGELRVSLQFESESAACPTCGVRSVHKHQETVVEVRDLPCFGRRVFLMLPRRRFKCKPCGAVFTEHLPFVEFRTSFTKRYEQYIYEQCRERSFTTVERQEGISDTVIAKVYEAYASASTEPRGRPRQIRVLGIDEISVRKGHKDFLCVIADIDRKCVIEVLENRLKETVIAYLSALPLSVRRSVRYVSIDMWEGYYQAVKEALPKGVKVVVDRFHVMENLNAAITKCRREIQRGMSKEQRDELKGLRWILVKNEESLSEEEKAKLQDMYAKCPELKTCHQLKEEFRRIFQEQTARPKAKAKLEVWKQRVRETALKSFEGFLKTLDNWEEWILNYFSSGKVTNGTVEGLNNKIKLIKRRGYGYRNNGNFRQRILVECGC